MAAEDHGMKSLLGLPARSRDGILVVVETPAGSRSKLKYLPELGQVALSRPLPLGLHYPFDWGFVPSTRAPTKSEKKDIRLLGWGGVDEAERVLAEAERLAGS
jgi:inorganic pyrophosphatase